MERMRLDGGEDGGDEAASRGRGRRPVTLGGDDGGGVGSDDGVVMTVAMKLRDDGDDGGGVGSDDRVVMTVAMKLRDDRDD